jgi:Glycosyltransferase family 87
VESLATGAWLDRGRVIRVAGICGIISALCIIVLFATSHGTLDYKGRPLGTDFSDVWTAGKMAVDGSAAKIWSWPDHFAVQRLVHHKADVEFYGWHYPPPFLLVAWLLAQLPYIPALIAWQLSTLAPFTRMMWQLVPRRETILLTLAAPVTLICLTHGHNGFLTALLLGGGLMVLDKRPFVAGLLFGCLVYKPQFALVLPVLLLAGRHWRAVAGAMVSAAALVGLTLAIWGWPVWQAFIGSLPLTQHVVIEQGSTGFYKIMSPFAAVRLWGGSIGLGYAVQSMVTAASIAALAWLSWSKARSGLRNAFVCAAAILSTPYVLDYDLVVLLPALAWLWLDAKEHGFLRWEATLMAFIWFTPLVGRGVAQWTLVPLGFMSVVALAGIVLRRALTASPSRRLRAAFAR